MRRRAITPFLTPLFAGILFSSPSTANVAYDVVTTYNDGSYYSFRMEFANDTGTKTITDLIGSDFTNETFYHNPTGSTLSLDHDLAPFDFSFNPLSLQPIQFTSYDSFSNSLVYINTEDSVYYNGADIPPATNQYFVFYFSIDVTRVTSVPEPTPLALTALGLAGLGAFRRKEKSHLQRNSVLRHTSAASV